MTVARALRSHLRSAVRNADRLDGQAAAAVRRRFKEMERRIIDKARRLARTGNELDLDEIGKLDRFIGDELTKFQQALLAEHRRLEKLAIKRGEVIADVPVRALRLNPATLPLPASTAGTIAPDGFFQYEGTDFVSVFQEQIRDAVVKKLGAVVAGDISMSEGIRKLRDDISGPRSHAERVMRTEVGRALSEATQKRMSGLADLTTGGEKQWVATLDSRTRASHVAAHRQVRPVGEPFMIGGYNAMYPRDPSLPAKEAINCRCVVVPKVSAQALDTDAILALARQRRR